MNRQKVVIMGAAGRDFHNFNVAFRDCANYQVIAFTATQIPYIAQRTYPPSLAGPLYPQGIPICPEEDLEDLMTRHEVDQVILAYSDISHQYVMDLASRVLAGGADFRLMGPRTTMLEARVPVVSVCAVRTGSGKSQTTRRVIEILRQSGKRVVTIRHPMPYGDLANQVCERFATYDDLARFGCTIEEREEYEPLLDCGAIVYAGVDYAVILQQAEQEADVIVWDGGNNDLPFYRPALHIVVADPLRPGHELTYYPGQVNLRMADVVLINKVDTANYQDVVTVRKNARTVNPDVTVIEAASPISVPDPAEVRGKTVLVVEDGPTLTHGGMTYGAGVVAAQRYGAAQLIDPRPYALGSIKDTLAQYPKVGPVLPAMGYGAEQVKELEETIRAVPCELVLAATPIDLRRLFHVRQPMIRVSYELQEIGRPTLDDVLAPLLS